MYDTLFRWANRIALAAALTGGATMIFASVMVTFDVLIRKFFNTTLGGADEISGYLFAIATSWALPYAFLRRANVRIDALYVHMPRIACAVVDLLGAALLGLFAIALTWRAIALVADSVAIGARSVTPLHVPLVLPQSFWLAGWVMFSLCLLLVVFGIVRALMRRDLWTVHRLAGAMSVEEEIEDEGIRVRRTSEDRR